MKFRVIGQPTEPRCTGFLAVPGQRPHIQGMNLELNDMQAEALTRALHKIIQTDSYRLSPCIVALKELLGQLRPEPALPAPCRRGSITSRNASPAAGGSGVNEARRPWDDRHLLP